MSTPDSTFHPSNPLMEAILIKDEQESLQWIKELLEAGEDPNQVDYDCYAPPLYEAWSKGRTEIVRILLEFGAIISVEVNPLDEFTIGSVPIEATLLILEAGHSFNECIKMRENEIMCSTGSNPLTLLLDYELWDHIQIFKQYDLMRLLNAFNNLGLTPLAEMASDNKIKQAKWLLNERANVNAHCGNHVGNTALDEAVLGKHLAMTKLLLEAGANPNIRTNLNDCCTDRALRTVTSTKVKNRNEQSVTKEIRQLVLEASKKFPFQD